MPDLAGGLDALDAADAEHGPGGHQTQHHRPVDAAGLGYGGSTVQGDAVPEVVHWGTPLTLWHQACSRVRLGDMVRQLIVHVCARVHA